MENLWHGLSFGEKLEGSYVGWFLNVRFSFQSSIAYLELQSASNQQERIVLGAWDRRRQRSTVLQRRRLEKISDCVAR